VTTLDGERFNVPGVGRGVLDELFVLVLAGIPTGVVVAGVGSRLAMLVLRLTSDSSVIGMRSDDDFTIGRFTLGGTYNLLVIGAMVGILGAAAYKWVRPWLLGPRWFRHATVGLASGAVVGPMLIHADGIDFRALTPTWLAIAMFVALPVMFGLSIAWTVDRVDRADSFARRGRARWYLAATCVLLFPPTLLLLTFSAGALVVWVSLREARSGSSLIRASPALKLCMRGIWLGIAVVGLVALVNDIREIAAVT
jgi:hypothetical protein